MADEKPRPPSRGRLHLVVVSHDRTLLDRECDEVGLPGRLGDLGILPGHAAYVGALRPGVLTLLDGRDTVRAAISAGFCEVLADQVTVLVDDARFPADLDAKQSAAALQEALSQLEHAESEEIEAIQDRIALAEAQVAIAAAG
ncbi:MAG: ATP synthase F1 subunit epsilon [Acidobacteria bacterium]|nr:MAG: ATP synthase F1 subunit epsilon [Acidobacteriota bacterium]REK03693.1 MAG: ATP synthase F1 subunit epsilon [Acidobacteriota bacterium]